MRRGVQEPLFLRRNDRGPLLAHFCCRELVQLLDVRKIGQNENKLIHKMFLCEVGSDDHFFASQ